MDPDEYEAWYHTQKGAWISDRELTLMRQLMMPEQGQTLLDAGAGTGHFTRRFSELGLTVTGLEPDHAMLTYAREHSNGIDWVEGRVERLPFPDGSFDWVTAVTSLCFVATPVPALEEMWRVARRGVLVGLLNRRSLLFLRKAGKGGYAGARWDNLADARQWAEHLSPPPQKLKWGTAVLSPSAGPVVRLLEPRLPRHLPWGAFLALCWFKEGG